MSRSKSVGQRIDPWGTPAFTGYSSIDFDLESLKLFYYWERKK